MVTADDHEYTDRYVSCAEGRLRVIVAGDHGPPVLLLSGGGVDSATLSWRHLIPDLAREHRVYALDWPKQGASKPWHGVADHDRLLRCVIEVLDHFGLPRVAVVGLSQGGAVALGSAIEHPERIDRVVALAPGGTLSFPPVVHQLLWLIGSLPLLSNTLPSLMLRSRRQVEAFARRSLFAGPVPDFDQVIDEILAEAADGTGSSDWQNTSIGPLRMRVDLRPRLGEIACPVLFLQGDADVAVPARRTMAAARLVPRAELRILPGHGHWLNRQSPDLVNRLIIDFLDRTDQPGPPDRREQPGQPRQPGRPLGPPGGSR